MLCFGFHQKPKAVQTVKLTLDHRAETLPALIYRRLIHRMNQTAHISLQILSISKSVETKTTEMRPIFLARPACFISVILLRLVAVRPVWRPVVHLCVAGEVGSRPSRRNPQALFLRNVIFFLSFSLIKQNQYLTRIMPPISSPIRKIVSAISAAEKQ